MAESVWKLKVGRARHHLLDFETALREYSRQHPFEIVSELEGNDLVVRVHIRRAIPAELSLIVGDLLHNARSALDLLVMSIAKSAASESGCRLSPADERSLSFPITRTEADFERAARKLGRYLPDDTVHSIWIVQPWNMAEAVLEKANEEITSYKLQALIYLDLLYRLRRLNNLDKHQQLIAVAWFPGRVTLGDELGIEPLEEDSDDPD